MTRVDLIASGYVWRCPECERLEYENAVPPDTSVRCSGCGAVFETGKILHRVDAGIMEPGPALSQLSVEPLDQIDGQDAPEGDNPPDDKAESLGSVMPSRPRSHRLEKVILDLATHDAKKSCRSTTGNSACFPETGASASAKARRC